MRMILVAFALLTVAGCTMTGERLAADGVTEHQIVCGSSAPWAVCESRAESLCPAGYTTLSKTWSLGGSEMWVRCKGG